MGHLKLLLVVVAITISNTVFANPELKFVDGVALSNEMQKTLQEVSCEEQVTVTVFFSISEDSRIRNLSIASSNEAVGKLLQRKLEGRELHGSFWQHGKIYEFTVTGSV